MPHRLRLNLGRRQCGGHIAERGQGSFQMVDDLLLQQIGWGQLIKVVEAVVLQPEDIQAGFVTSYQLLIAEEFKALGLLPLMAAIGVVASDEVLQIIQPKRPRLEREMLVGPQVVKPHTLAMSTAIF